MDLFYTPKYAKAGDVIPYYNEDLQQFDNFYLKNWNPDAPKDQVVYGWHRLSTKDNLHFTEEPTGIHGGTGSIVKHNDLYHMFYCTFDQNPDRQWVRHATSTDLTNWTDIPEEKFGPDGVIYKLSDWRDPFVFWNEEEGKWWMLLAARENAPTERNGCVGLCSSEDLSHWEYRKPLYAPRTHQAANECPDLFKMGDWYYLVYSNYTDGFCTYYRMSKSLNGPWIRPAIDTFDGRAFYAGKTGFDGKDRYIYGWNPTKGENYWNFDPKNDYGPDYQTWNWGGSIVVHKIIQHKDGTLGTAIPETVEAVLQKPIELTLNPILGDWKVGKDWASTDAEGGMAGLLGNKTPRLCCLKAKMVYNGEPARFGIGLQLDEDFSQGYYFEFEPWYNRIQFRSGLRMYEDGGKMFPYAVEMERPLKLEAGKVYEIKIFIQDSIAVLYVNDDLAFGVRMYNYTGRNFGLFSSDGTATFTNIRLLTE